VYFIYASTMVRKGKVVTVSKHHAMNMHGTENVKLHAFLTLTQIGNEWSASCSSCFPPKPLVPTGQ